MPIIDMPQGKVHYRVAGPEDSAHPPVVFVHGLLVNGELWTKVAEELAESGVRSYAPDLPLGAHRFGLEPGTDLSPQGVARLVNDFVGALGLRDVTLVGNDTGGALCQFLLDADPSRVGRLVLTNCDAFDEFPPAPFGMLVTMGRRAGRLRAMMQPMRLRRVRHSTLGFGGLVAKPLDPGLTRRWVTPALTDRDVRRDGARFMSAIKPQDLLEVSSRLHRFTGPVRLVWGAADPYFKLDLARRLQRVFADATLVEVPGGRAFLPLDEPERVAREILASHQARA